MPKIIPFRYENKKRTLLEDLKRNGISSERVEIVNQVGKVILWQSFYYYEHTTWCSIKAVKGKHYFCEYTCPYSKITIKEWIHENFVELMYLRLE